MRRRVYHDEVTKNERRQKSARKTVKIFFLLCLLHVPGSMKAVKKRSAHPCPETVQGSVVRATETSPRSPVMIATF
jgi:hypothetical protein